MTQFNENVMKLTEVFIYYTFISICINIMRLFYALRIKYIFYIHEPIFKKMIDIFDSDIL